MIGKPQWFGRRKYTGWGIYPKSWQGVVYIILFLIPIILIQSISNLSAKTKTIATLVWVFILILDVVDMMRKIKMDEREKIHESISERNALWGILVVLVIGLFYDILKNLDEGIVQINPFIIGALVVGTIIKGVSNFLLNKRN